MENNIDKNFINTFKRPFRSKIGKESIKIYDQRGLVFILETHPFKYVPEFHDDIISDLIKSLNGEEAKWVGIEKHYLYASIYSGLNLGPLWVSFDYRGIYSIKTLEEILLPYIIFHVFGTISYAAFLLEKYYGMRLVISPLMDEEQSISKSDLDILSETTIIDIEKAVENEFKYLEGIAIIKSVLQNSDTSWDETKIKTLSPELEVKLKDTIRGYLTRPFFEQKEENTKNLYIKTLLDILKQFPIALSQNTIKDRVLS